MTTIIDDWSVDLGPESSFALRIIVNSSLLNEDQRWEMQSVMMQAAAEAGLAYLRKQGIHREIIRPETVDITTLE